MFVEHPGVTKNERVALYKLIVARSDISEALFATRLFLNTVKDMSDENYVYLQNSIVTAYGRLFKKSRPHGFSLSEPDWPGFSSKNIRDIHDLLIEHRDKLVAHSDGKYRIVQILPPGISIAPDSSPSVGLGVQVSTTK